MINILYFMVRDIIKIYFVYFLLFSTYLFCNFVIYSFMFLKEIKHLTMYVIKMNK